MHRLLIKVDDATGFERPDIIYFNDGSLISNFNKRVCGMNRQKELQRRRSRRTSATPNCLSLRWRCASGPLLRPQSLAAQATEAPLPPDPHLVVSAAQCAHQEIRAHHGAS